MAQWEVHTVQYHSYLQTIILSTLSKGYLAASVSAASSASFPVGYFLAEMACHAVKMRHEKLCCNSAKL